MYKRSKTGHMLKLGEGCTGVHYTILVYSDRITVPRVKIEFCTRSSMICSLTASLGPLFPLCPLL